MAILARTALLAGSIITAFFIQPYRPVLITGSSMSPTFNDGALVFARSLKRAPRVGDVVLVEKDGVTLIKRVAMVAGDEYREIYVPSAHGWAPVTTPHVEELVTSGKFKGRTTRIPPEKIFVLGDNSEMSIDSRDFGCLPVTAVRGLVGDKSLN